ncbi:helix-turn-helix transcriptional regulator [Sedimentitalea todarodis]|uniref:YafY family protein n=1 Tax=Sedimentitalea todarodis TaxID=1631240 RepID=A0ABU3VA95_9RHOB|nr:YafY family protein [Sedimentitalea todarodis]MDU9002684.1 YafY family protein [Sedimentitalea todarodis]
MARTDRLITLIGILRDGALHRAQDLAARLDISVRTIYRDMDRLLAAGVPVQGTPGTGYRMADTIALPPLHLAPAELDVLQLGIAIVSEAADPNLRAAAQTLANKIDMALPAETIAEADAWKTALSPMADAARGLSHMTILRSAIDGRQKLRLSYRETTGQLDDRIIRPLKLESWGRAWLLTAWCETCDDFRDFRLDLIENATPLPELFTDEHGKRLADRRS